MSMDSPAVLSTTVALMALVAVTCTVLCIAWSVPSLRRRLGHSDASSAVSRFENSGLTGWSATLASGIVSIGIAVCAAVAWYGCYSILCAMGIIAVHGIR
ncbi:MAG: hypothetical protein ACO3FE_19630 [Planctomycetaceae bacterium]